MGDMNWLRIGAVLGGLAVATGAFGAHALEGFLRSQSADSPWVGSLSLMEEAKAKAEGDRRVAVYETAARYQMYHALALVAVGLLAGRARPTRALGVAGWSFFAGTLVFSGSLYALALSGIKWLGAITPIGGVLFLVGWASLAAHRPIAERGGAYET